MRLTENKAIEIDLDAVKSKIAEQESKTDKILAEPEAISLGSLFGKEEEVSFENPFSLIEIDEFESIIANSEDFHKGIADALEVSGYFLSLMNAGMPYDLVKDLVILKINSEYEQKANALILEAQTKIAKEKTTLFTEQTM